MSGPGAGPVTSPPMDDVASLIMSSVEQFCRQRLGADEVRRRDEEHQPPYDLVPAMAELGLIRAPFPESHGGLGLSWSLLCRIQERLGYHAYFAGSILNRFISFAGMPILRFGSEAQRAAFLPEILAGRVLIALALSEPEAGSDVRAVRTRATREGAGWRVRGRKTWISDAGGAAYLLTLCRTGEGRGRDAALTAFLVPTRASGVSMTELPKVGNHCMPSWDIGLDDVLVDDGARLGPVGHGFEVVTGTLAYSRASMSATVTGCAQSALDLAIAHARERQQFGRPLVRFQVLRHRLVDMRMEVEKARLLVYELARRIDAGEDTGELSAIAKIAATEALQFVTDHGMQILASAGYARESAMQRYWRDARLYTFGEGTNEIQREIIAGHMGLR